MSDAWRALVQEEIVEPDLPIIDPHHHLWPGVEYYQEGPYLLENLRADVESGHNIVATVYLECGANYFDTGPEQFRPVGETSYVNAAADEAERIGLYTKVCAGIVCDGSLVRPDVADVLDAHKAAAPERMRGVRHIACPQPLTEETVKNSPPVYDDPAFRRGFAELAPRGLTFDSCLYHFKIPELTRLARDFPDTTIVLDHIGGPLGLGPYAGKIAQAIEEWRPHLIEIAKCPNVVAKIGGQGMFIAGRDFHTRDRPPTSDEYLDQLGDLLKFVIDAFGPDRAMFESNFPVDGLSSSYAVLWNAFKKLSAGYSAAERTALFSGTAARVYRLEHLL